MEKQRLEHELDKEVLCLQDPVFMSSLNKDVTGPDFQVCAFGRITKILANRVKAEKISMVKVSVAQ